MARSLSHHYGRRGVWIPLLLASSIGTLIAGLLLPVMTITKLIFWEDDYGVIAGARRLWAEGYWLLGSVIFVFSAIVPTTKLIALTWIWFARLPEQRRARWLNILGIVGKWSMMDVFVVALTVILAKSSLFGDVSPRIGLYIFAASVILQMIAAELIEHLAKRAVA